MSYKKFLKAVTLPKAKLGVRSNSGDGTTSMFIKDQIIVAKDIQFMMVWNKTLLFRGH